MNKTFCFKPWTEIYSHFGNVGPCCVNYEHFNGSLDDYLQSAELKELKKYFLEGKKHPSCVACWETEKSGVKSLRQLDTIRAKSLKTISISINNKCNFKCRMCNPADSSAWAKDAEACDIRGLPPTQTIKAHDKVDWVINKCKDSFLNVRVMGGEPLITDEFVYFLKLVDKYNLYDNIYLVLTTNLSTLSYKGTNFLEYFDKFKKLDVYASFDGVGEVGEYIRHGFLHDKFVSNLRLAKKYIKFLSVTLQLYNLYDAPNIKKFADIHNLIINYNFLTDPDFLRVENLSKKQRDKLMAYYKEKSFYDREIFSVLNSDVYLNMTDKFLSYTENLDLLWNKNFSVSIPQLYYELS